VVSKRGAGDWTLIVAATVGAGWLVGEIGLPSGYLFTALLVGLLYALLAPGRVRLPAIGFPAGQAIAGVVLGTFLHTSTLTGLGTRWIPVVLVSVATLAVTIVVGIVLARMTRLDRPTASLGMVAGGASGIVAMAGDLGADDRLVAFMQYLRVLIIALLTPLLVPLFFGGHAEGGPSAGPLFGTVSGWVLTIGASVAGAWLAPHLRFPAPAFFGPLVLTGILSLTGAIGDTQVPALAREIGFALIGLHIGLGFDQEVLAEIARVAWIVVAAIGVLLVACFVLGWLLQLTAGVSLLDGYLATTPGGLFAVLPIAYGSGADTTFVLAVQSLRLLGMIVAAPAVVRVLTAGPRTRQAV
jgi:membrane AbrB-like protein